MKKEKGHILMTGGGTLGPVTPLLGVAEEWKKEDSSVNISWIGTPGGPEREVVEVHGYDFTALHAPKLSRDRVWTWIFIPFLFAWSFLRAFFYLRNKRPAIIFTAGGYVSVPVVFAGQMLGIPTWVHQLDAVPGIANRLMAFVAKKISVTWTEVPASFEKYEPVNVGSVIRNNLREGNGHRIKQQHNLLNEKKTLLIFGGGTGAASLNAILEVIGKRIANEVNVIHITGKGKMLPGLEDIAENYVAVEFAGKEMADYYDAADMVLGRAGMGTVLEVSALRKPAMLIPLHNTDQLANAKAFEEAEAGKVLWKINGQVLQQELLKFIEDESSRQTYRRNASMLFKEYGEKEIVRRAIQLLEE